MFAFVSLTLALTLTAETFKNMLANQVAILLFHVPWCPHCVSFKRESWDTLQREYRYESSLLVAEVDCVQDQALCGRLHVQSYPTVRTFVPPDLRGVDYLGARTRDAVDNVLRSLFTQCSFSRIELCNATEREWMDEWQELSYPERTERRIFMLDALREGERWHNQTVRTLRQRYRYADGVYQSLKLRTRRLLELLDGIPPPPINL